MIFKPTTSDATPTQRVPSVVAANGSQGPDIAMSEAEETEQQESLGAELEAMDLEECGQPDSNEDLAARSQQTSENLGDDTENIEVVAGSTWSMRNIVRTNAGTVTQGMRKVSTFGVQGARMIGARTAVVGSVVKNAIKDVNSDKVTANMKKVGTFVNNAGSLGVTSVKKVADFGFQTIQQAPELGISLAATAAASAAAVVPMRIGMSDGAAREAGFVVFNDLYTTQAARQMMHHPSGKLLSCQRVATAKSSQPFF